MSVGARDPQQTPGESKQVYLFVGYKGFDVMDWIEEVKLIDVTSGLLHVRIPLFEGQYSIGRTVYLIKTKLAIQPSILTLTFSLDIRCWLTRWTNSKHTA